MIETVHTADPLAARALEWLLERDEAQPGPRYFALRDLLGRPAGDREVIEAREAVMRQGPVPAILAAQQPDGSGLPPPGTRGGYRDTTSQVVFLAELGASPADDRVRRACDFVLERYISASGAFSYTLPPIPSRAVHCYNGMLIGALARLGFDGDERLRAAAEWQAAAITGEGGARYYKSGTTGPGFRCAMNIGQPCAWGATKALRGLLAIEPTQRSPLVARALDMGGVFLLSHDPAVADYPYTSNISGHWFKFGFPLSYWSDVIEVVEVLAALGYGRDPRLARALDLIRSKRDAAGRWLLESTIEGKTWFEAEQRGQPSKWVTLRALKALNVSESPPPTPH